MLNRWDVEFYKKQLKILKTQTLDWEKEDIQRLLALLKVQQILQSVLSIHQSQNLLNIEYLQQSVEPNLTDVLYFPYQKFKAIVFLLKQLNKQSQQPGEDFENSTLIQKDDKLFNGCCIEFEEQSILKLKEIIDTLQETLIIQLSSLKIISILKKIGIKQQKINIVKSYHCDGFSLVCILVDHFKINEIKGLFSQQDVQLLVSMSILFLTQYFRQKVKMQVQQQKVEEKQEKTIKNSIQIDELQMMSSTDIGKKYSQEDIETQFLKQLPQSVILDQSQYSRNNELGHSQYEYGQSQYAVSERGSVFAQSVYGRGSYFPRQSTFQGSERKSRLSQMYDPGILLQLKESSLDLPFNLLNLDPLQTIKIRPMTSPFSKEIDKDYYWTFSLQGAKFGRDRQNDLRFPDQSHISSRHAQIFFRNDQFYLQDLGSKTGTFIRLRGLITLHDETCIQLNHDTQIIFRILKKQKNEGVIKAEFKKPENLPDYKISLRDNYKMKIGRSMESHLRIDLPSINERHAQIYYKNGIFSYKGCSGSTSGSWQRLSQRSIKSEGFRLSKGDIFRLSSKKSFYVEEIENHLGKNDFKS